MKKHILIIDDEEPIRKLLNEVLTRQCYRVSEAGSGARAKEIVQADPPDLIITDLQMEDTDGLALVEQIKQVLPRVPVILLTGVLFDPEVVRDTLSSKVSCYLQKTTPLKQVIGEIRKLLGETPSPQP
jgi:DNA-binding NtrC family response regulator